MRPSKTASSKTPQRRGKKAATRKKPKILLVFTNLSSLLPQQIFPYDIGALSAFLKQNGYQPDTHIINRKSQLNEFKSVLEERNPDLVGFTGVYCEFRHVSKLAAKVKSWKNVQVLMGGKHATLAPEMVLKDPNIDGVCVGEGEGALLDYMQAIESGSDHRYIENLWFKDNGGIIRNPGREYIQDLDSLPYVDYGIVDLQKYINSNLGVLYMVVGRGGCNGNCIFCGVPPQAKRGKGQFVRRKSVDYYLDELEYLEKKYDFKHIYYRDDFFTGDREWFLEFAEKYPRRFRYTYEFLTRADGLDQEVMDAMKDSHCDCVWLGVDSGNQYIRNEVLKKNLANEILEERAEYLKKLGIKILTTNMIGFPYETPERFKETINLNKRIYANNPTISRAYGLCPSIYVVCPFPGTPLYQMCENKGWLEEIPEDHVAYSDSYLNMPQFTKFQIQIRKFLFRYLILKDTNRLWAIWYLIRDSLIEPAPNRRPMESQFLTLEYFIRYGEWLKPNPFEKLPQKIYKDIEGRIRLKSNDLRDSKIYRNIRGLLIDKGENRLARGISRKYAEASDYLKKMKNESLGIIKGALPTDEADFPGCGEIVDIPNSNLSIKLEKEARFYRRIGQKDIVEAPGGKVFCLVEFLWIPKDPEEKNKLKPPVVSLQNGSDDFFPQSAEAKQAFLDMQNREVYPPKIDFIDKMTRDVRVFLISPDNLHKSLSLVVQPELKRKPVRIMAWTKEKN